MVKKIIYLFTLLVLLTNFSMCEASMDEGDDGLYYRNGDPNYLVIDHGNKFYTVADLSSAWLDFRSQGNIMVVFNTFMYSFSDEELVAKHTDIFIEEIKTGTVYFEGIIWCHNIESKYPYKQRRHIYAKLKASAIDNQK